MKIRLLAALAAIVAVQAEAQVPVATQLKVERVVLLMRHGVRPPTKAPAMPAGVAASPWPDWPVAPGWLTPHGAAAIRLVAASDRAGFVADGLLPGRGCPSAGDVRLIADSDQRTIATAQAYAEALAPGCPLAVEHRPQGERDPLFSPGRSAGGPDEAAARAAALAAAGPGGLAAVDAREAPALARLDAILCAGATSCGLGTQPTTLSVNDEGRVKLAGRLDRGSTAAQVLLLEYADGKPLGEVGWGRASAADIALLSRLHATEFALVARPKPLARRNLAQLMPLIRAALLGEKGPRVTMIAGHDTNIANLAGMLDAHWTVPGFATDDPSPGGALVLERVVDHKGRRFVRAFYRSQTLEQIRSLTPLDATPPVMAELRLRQCPTPTAVSLCPIGDFSHLAD